MIQMKELSRNVIVFIESEIAVYMFVKSNVWFDDVHGCSRE